MAGGACRRPLAGHVHGAAVRVQHQRPPLRRAHGGDQVPERAERQPRVGVQGHPPAHRPAVEAVDGRAEVGLEAVQAELGDVGDAEEAGLRGVEVVGAVRPERQVGRPGGGLPAVAAVAGPPAHLGRLARDEALLAHDRPHDLLRDDDRRGRVPLREVAPGDRLSLPAP